MMWPFKRKRWEDLGKSITRRFLFDALLIGLSPNDIFIRDTIYQAIPYKDFEWLMMGRNPEPEYCKDKFDCDNFAVCFMADIYRIWAEKSRGNEALAFGYVSGILEDGTNHAWIWHLDDEGIIRHIEPQTDTLRSGFKKINLVEA